VHRLVKDVAQYSRRQSLLKAGDRVGVAVSGGADSVALLRLLLELRAELGIVLSVVHFNHKLRGAEADADEQFVAELARQHTLELHSASGDVGRYASEHRLSQEAAARAMRYAYFERLLREGAVDCIATAHTLDDQAETVLLRLARGVGTRGLAGIYPESYQHSALSTQRTPGSIIRPLLNTRRAAIETYLAELEQTWREDKSNRDLRHARNRVRHGILPRLERNLNPAVREVLAETAEIARAEEEYWQAQIAQMLPEVWNTGTGRLKLKALAAMPLAIQRRVVRAAGESLGVRPEFRHVEEILALVQEKPGAAAVLPGQWKVRREAAWLHFAPVRIEAAGDYEYSLPLPGSALVPEAGLRVEVLLVKDAQKRGYNPEELLDAGLLCGELRVRNWRAGDRFWPARRKEPKKVKELLQERHLTGAQRKLWPVVVSGGEVVWVRGFPPPARMRPRGGAAEAVLIREVTEK
jgi:tRNA(Ile)-lysidine synthase